MVQKNKLRTAAWCRPTAGQRWRPRLCPLFSATFRRHGLIKVAAQSMTLNKLRRRRRTKWAISFLDLGQSYHFYTSGRMTLYILTARWIIKWIMLYRRCVVKTSRLTAYIRTCFSLFPFVCLGAFGLWLHVPCRGHRSQWRLTYGQHLKENIQRNTLLRSLSYPLHGPSPCWRMLHDVIIQVHFSFFTFFIKKIR